MKQHQQGKFTAALLGFITGVAATTAATGYLFYGPHGKGNRKQVESWVKEARKEITNRLKQAKNITEETYQNIVTEVVQKFAALKDIGQEEAEEVAADFKSRIKEISSEVQRLKKEYSIDNNNK